MNVAALSSAGQASQTSAASAATVDYESFLKLLVAQMKNQDPTAPMESTEYVAQLATFSQVEQQVQMNRKLDDILQASALSQASGLIGREVVSHDGSVSGKVKEIKLFSDGVVAVLESGGQIPILPGVTIR
ncbi:flagellar hook assembly protein FlgD [Mesorhizobium sp. YIM 152430]|jgi:flagellar basal-body rod modification protein FlgD|uniref:flagellar hook assembly protein FlgD n=1 Tax=Mesorhizobium sp. YIM 152430 TaxID=3031761 RepID=UPI0023DCE9F6|nr:flagellar hook assembly protein FlgD [Mesorhizobium sp. YIM 152430]MDF1601674.1 flagellar hook assembly protein FlgD [Mesorhizobium sp. YIM 152430]